MNATSIARLVVYAAGLGASLLALAGYAQFDAATGELDILPFNISIVATWCVTAFSNALAGIALLRGWGKK
jgi:hypothetical protein